MRTLKRLNDLSVISELFLDWLSSSFPHPLSFLFLQPPYLQAILASISQTSLVLGLQICTNVPAQCCFLSALPYGECVYTRAPIQTHVLANTHIRCVHLAAQGSPDKSEPWKGGKEGTMGKQTTESLPLVILGIKPKACTCRANILLLSYTPSGESFLT